MCIVGGIAVGRIGPFVEKVDEEEDHQDAEYWECYARELQLEKDVTKLDCWGNKLGHF